MQASVSETSTELLLDLVSKFLFKLLGKDENYSQYLKHWSSFRQVLYATPFNVDPALSYIATLDGQLSPSPKANRPRPSNLSGISSPMNVQPLNLSENASNASLESLENSIKSLGKGAHHRTHSSHQGSQTSSPEEKLRMNAYKPSNFRHESIGDSGATTISDRFKNTILPDYALNCVSRNASFGSVDGTDSPKDSTAIKMDNILAGVKTTTPYSLSFLSGLSRKLSNNILTHNQQITKEKKEEEIVLEERSPLRKLKVHGKKEDNLDLLERIEKMYKNTSANTYAQPTYTNQPNQANQVPTYTLKHWIV
jgi:hypothetical protein